MLRKADAKSADRSLLLLFAAEAVTSAGTTLLSIGIFFYTVNRFAWDARRNFLLAASQGVAYALGALCAHAVSTRFGRRRSLIALHAMLAMLCIVLLSFQSHAVFVATLLIYSFIAAVNWPMLESLTAGGADTEAHEMSRRLGMYNIIWAATGAIAVLCAGSLIQRRQGGVFTAALSAHLVSLICLIAISRRPTDDAQLAAQPAQPEPQLQHSRTLALWLSRISLPAMYVLNYGLSAMLPLLPVMHGLSPARQTVLAAVWMLARWLAFIVLTATVFWHTRPRLLLVAATVMCVAFFVVTVPPSLVLPGGASRTGDLLSMIAGQIALGFAMGLIYTASLYFGMVLSDGSTEHGGYHEALIGLGSVLGPGAGAIAQILRPNDMRASIGAVGGLVAASTLLALVASLLIRVRRNSS